MVPVPLHKFPAPHGSIPAAFSEMESLFDKVRERAYELFQQRRRGHGFALDDWLDAERELMWKPESELVEKENEFQIRVAVPGLEAKDLEVSVLPETIVVRGRIRTKEDRREGKVWLSEFSEKQLCREFGMPATVDVHKVVASLEKGILTIIAPKAVREKRETRNEKKLSAAA